MEKEDYTEDILIKTLMRDKLSLTIEEKGFALKELKTKYGLSNRRLGNLIGEPHSTIHDWISGRQQKQNRNIVGNLHISLTRIKEHLEVYEPKNIREWGDLKAILDVLNNKIKNSPLDIINKNLGWSENEDEM